LLSKTKSRLKMNEKKKPAKQEPTAQQRAAQAAWTKWAKSSGDKAWVAAAEKAGEAAGLRAAQMAASPEAMATAPRALLAADSLTAASTRGWLAALRLPNDPAQWSAQQTIRTMLQKGADPLADRHDFWPSRTLKMTLGDPVERLSRPREAMESRGFHLHTMIEASPEQADENMDWGRATGQGMAPARLDAFLSSALDPALTDARWIEINWREAGGRRSREHGSDARLRARAQESELCARAAAQAMAWHARAESLQGQALADWLDGAALNWTLGHAPWAKPRSHSHWRADERWAQTIAKRAAALAWSWASGEEPMPAWEVAKEMGDARTAAVRTGVDEAVFAGYLERGALLALSRMEERGLAAPDEAFGPKTLALVERWKTAFALRRAKTQESGQDPALAFWTLGLGAQPADSRARFSALQAAFEAEQGWTGAVAVAALGERLRAAREAAGTESWMALAREAMGGFGPELARDAADAIEAPVAERPEGAAGRSLSVIGALFIRERDGRWRATTKPAEIEQEGFWERANIAMPGMAGRINESARAAAFAFDRGFARGCGNERNGHRDPKEIHGHGAPVVTGVQATERLLQFGLWALRSRERHGDGAADQGALQSLKSALDLLSKSGVSAENHGVAGERAARALARRAVEAIAREAMGPGRETEAKGIAELVENFAAIQGRQNFVGESKALDWAGRDPGAAARLHASGAAGGWAAREAFQGGALPADGLEQALWARLQEAGLSRAGWRLLCKMPFAAGLAIHERVEASCAPKEAEEDVCAVIGALADAGVEPERAALVGVLATAQGRAHNYLARDHWSKLAAALRTPRVVEGEDAKQNRLEKNKIKKLNWAKESKKRLARAAAKNEAIDSEALERDRVAFMAPEPRPADRVEDETQRSRRLELTRALADWAAQRTLAARSAAESGSQLAEQVCADVGSVHDWLRMDQGGRAREALPRRFGPAALRERVERWHAELAANRSLADKQRAQEIARRHAHATVRAGHAESIEAALAKIDAGEWPMAVGRVEGSALAAEALAGGMAQDRAQKLAPWVAVGLATAEALAEEGAAMSHCVGGYATVCAQGDSRIFSVREAGAAKSTGTLELRLQKAAGGDKWGVVQFLGSRNTRVDNEAAKAFASGVAEAYTRATRRCQEAQRAAAERDAAAAKTQAPAPAREAGPDRAAPARRMR
jgi:hypothetical protein